MKKFHVRFGHNAYNRSILVEAENETAAVAVAREKLIAQSDDPAFMTEFLDEQIEKNKKVKKPNAPLVTVNER